MRAIELYKTLETALPRAGMMEVWVKAQDDMGNEVLYKVRGTLGLGVNERNEQILVLR